MAVFEIFVCAECGQKFDIRDTEQANEFFNGHDCEEQEGE